MSLGYDVKRVGDLRCSRRLIGPEFPVSRTLGRHGEGKGRVVSDPWTAGPQRPRTWRAMSLATARREQKNGLSEIGIMLKLA